MAIGNYGWPQVAPASTTGERGIASLTHPGAGALRFDPLVSPLYASEATMAKLPPVYLNAAGLDPTAVVGGKVNVLGSNAKLGKSELMVVDSSMWTAMSTSIFVWAIPVR